MCATQIYLAFTPYHVFLASMIALSRPECSHVLLVISDFYALDIVSQLNNSPIFSECIALPGLYRQEKHLTAIRKNNIKLIDGILKRFAHIDTLFLGTDTRIEAQATAYKAKQKYPDMTIAVIEDGGDFYSSPADSSKKSFWRILHKKIIFGKWYEDVKIAGLFSYTDDLHVIFPQLIRPEIRHKKIVPIQGQACFSQAYQDFAYDYWRMFEDDYNKIHDADGLLLIAYSGFGKKYSEYPVLIQNICKEAAKKNMQLAVKYHPREKRNDYCNLASMPHITQLSAQTPAEMIYASHPGNLKFVVGDVSSSLLTAKWLLHDEVRVYSVAKMLGIHDRLFKVFSQINIQLITQLSDFYQYAEAR